MLPSPAGRGHVNLLALPSPPPNAGYHLAPLAGAGAACLSGLPMDTVTFLLGRWLAQHMATPELVKWVIERHGILHPNWAPSLEDGMSSIGEPWKSFWRLLLDGATRRQCSAEFRWNHLPRNGEWRDGTDAAVLGAARCYLRACHRNSCTLPEHIRDLARFQLAVNDNDFLKHLWQERHHPAVNDGLFRLADALTSRLAEGLNLLQRADGFLVGINGREPLTNESRLCDDEDHTLVLLLVHAFDHARTHAPDAAIALARRWIGLWQGSRIFWFRRMALYALAQFRAVLPEEEVDFILRDHGEVLWADDCQTKLGLYFGNRAAALPLPLRLGLVDAVAQGPAPEIFPSFTGTPEEFRDLIEWDISRRLAALNHGGVPLPEDLMARANQAHGELETPRVTVHTGRRQPVTTETLPDLPPADLAEALLQENSQTDTHEQFGELCTNRPALALQVIPILAERADKSWTPWGRITEFTNIEDNDLRRDVVRCLLQISQLRPQWLGDTIVRELSRILETFAKQLPSEGEQRSDFLALWLIVWTASIHHDRSALRVRSGPLDAALNAPGGTLGHAALHLALAQERAIPADIQPLLDLIAEGDEQSHRYGRIMLATGLAWLHPRNRHWVTTRIIARMQHGHPEAPGLWQAFFHSGRWNVDLMEDLSPAFLSLAGHLEVERLSRSWNSFFADMLMESPTIFGSPAVSRVMRTARGEDLAAMAWHFSQRLNGAGDKAAELWAQAIKPIVEKRWPSSRDKRTPATVMSLVNMAVKTREAFPDVIEVLTRRTLLGSVGPQQRTLFQLYNNPALVTDHPQAVLTLLSTIITNAPPHWEKDRLMEILNRLAEALSDDTRLIHLRTLCQ